MCMWYANKLKMEQKVCYECHMRYNKQTMGEKKQGEEGVEE